MKDRSEACAQMPDPLFVLREPVIRSAIRKARFVPNSQGLDIGCGNGEITRLLAESIEPGGRVTGVDISREMVASAREAAEKIGLSHRLCFHTGDMKDIPIEDDSFDWVWSMDCVGYVPIEPLPLIKELVRVTKPGGRIVLLAWSSQQLLPGHPVLEAHLNATAAGIAPFSHQQEPEQHFLHASGWLEQLGLVSIQAHTFVRTVHAPLSDNIRGELESLLEMRWRGAHQELSQDDWQKFQQFCLPDSADYILHSPDYYGFFTYSLFQGQVPN